MSHQTLSRPLLQAKKTVHLQDTPIKYTTQILNFNSSSQGDRICNELTQLNYLECKNQKNTGLIYVGQNFLLLINSFLLLRH